MLGTILNAEDTAASETESSLSHGASILINSNVWEET